MVAIGRRDKSSPVLPAWQRPQLAWPRFPRAQQPALPVIGLSRIQLAEAGNASRAAKDFTRG